jgi:Mor family transcriptional regulator
MRDFTFYLKIIVIHIDKRHQNTIRYRAAEYFNGQSFLTSVGDAADAKIQRIAPGIKRNA